MSTWCYFANKREAMGEASRWRCEHKISLYQKVKGKTEGFRRPRLTLNRKQAGVDAKTEDTPLTDFVTVRFRKRIYPDPGYILLRRFQDPEDLEFAIGYHLNQHVLFRSDHTQRSIALKTEVVTTGPVVFNSDIGRRSSGSFHIGFPWLLHYSVRWTISETRRLRGLDHPCPHRRPVARLGDCVVRMECFTKVGSPR